MAETFGANLDQIEEDLSALVERSKRDGFVALECKASAALCSVAELKSFAKRWLANIKRGPRKAPYLSIPKRVVFIGDSITRAWPLGRYLALTHNAGVDGQDTQQMLARFQTDVLDQNPSGAIVILGGTNDVEFYLTPTVGYVRDMAIMGRSAGFKVILCTIPPFTETPTQNRANTTDAKVQVFNAGIREIAQFDNFPLADLYSAFLTDERKKDVSLFVPESNGESSAHPKDPQGYDRAFSALAPVLQDVL